MAAWMDLLTALAILMPCDDNALCQYSTEKLGHDTAVNPPAFVFDSLKRVALKWEVVAPHERWAPNYVSELCYVRRYWRALMFAPPLSDCGLLPPPGYAETACRINWAWQERITARRCVYPHWHDEMTLELEATKRIYAVWEMAKEAQIDDRSWAARRLALGRLRDLVGPAYPLPPPVPLEGVD